MDVVLNTIHYKPDCFSKIVEDFEYYVKYTRPGCFWKAFEDIKNHHPPTNRAALKYTQNSWNVHSQSYKMTPVFP